jgi:fatty-acyl-CoA synthase
LGERPAAFVIFAPGTAPTADAIRGELLEAVRSGRIKSYFVPEPIRITDRLPRTSVGKVDKRALRASLPTEPVASLDDLPERSG